MGAALVFEITHLVSGDSIFQILHFIRYILL